MSSAEAVAPFRAYKVSYSAYPSAMFLLFLISVARVQVVWFIRWLVYICLAGVVCRGNGDDYPIHDFANLARLSQILLSNHHKFHWSWSEVEEDTESLN